MTSRDNEAKLMLHRILDTFGNDQESERVQKMVRMYGQVKEKVEGTPTTPRGEYITAKITQKEAMLKKKSTDTGEYVKALCEYVENDPSDAEAWAELAEMYAGTGNFEQAVLAWKHVLVLEPNAYNAWARAGELYHLQAVTMQGGVDVATRNLEESVKCMCKSIEICPSYVRGLTGLYIYATKLSQWPKADRVQYSQLREKARMELSKSNDVFAKKVLDM